MRIAYISLHWPRTRNSGVGKKLQRQVTAWRMAGHEARLFMHTSRYEPSSELIEAEVFSYETGGKLKTELTRSQAMGRMLKTVGSFHPDVIYLRSGMYVFPAHRLMALAPVVMEINTNDLTQHEGLGGIYSLYNRLTRGLFLRRARGLVSVSRELVISPSFAVYRKPARVIANGIDLENFNPLPAPANSIPRLAFIGNPGYIWHGVDKLVALAHNCPDLMIDVIGYDQIPFTDAVPMNLILHGYLSAEAYLRILAGADAAVSSLGLHRIGLEEASPLKSRECLALGLPLVLAYIDTDLHDLDCDFLLKIPNKEDNIQTHGEMIRAFVYRVRGCRADRKLLAPRIDARYKEVRRLEFFQEVINLDSGVRKLA